MRDNPDPIEEKFDPYKKIPPDRRNGLEATNVYLQKYGIVCIKALVEESRYQEGIYYRLSGSDVSGEEVPFLPPFRELKAQGIIEIYMIDANDDVEPPDTPSFFLKYLRVDFPDLLADGLSSYGELFNLLDCVPVTMTESFKIINYFREPIWDPELSTNALSTEKVFFEAFKEEVTRQAREMPNIMDKRKQGEPECITEAQFKALFSFPFEIIKNFEFVYKIQGILFDLSPLVRWKCDLR